MPSHAFRELKERMAREGHAVPAPTGDASADAMAAITIRLAVIEAKLDRIANAIEKGKDNGR